MNQDGVLVSGADNGSMRFWDYATGHCFQSDVTKAQPGSLDSEAGIYASTFDKTGLYVACHVCLCMYDRSEGHWMLTNCCLLLVLCRRLITCEADKTIKVWQEDASASEESHPIDMVQWTKDFTAPKRY